MDQMENSYIFDPESPQEMARLINQDRFMTQTMGGALAGLPEIEPVSAILDLACGPGGWVLDVAYELPDVNVYGVDVSRTMIDYANARARSQNLVNASFGVMDIRQPLDFSDASFDLVNARLLYVALKREAWPVLLTECKRLLRPGGIVRLTEVDDFGSTNSAAYEQFSTLNIQALLRAGYGLSPERHNFGMSTMLLSLLKDAGWTDLHLRSSIADYSAETDGWADFYHSGRIAVLQIKQFLIASGQLTAERFEQLYQQMLGEMQAKQFVATWHVTSVWGRAPQ